MVMKIYLILILLVLHFFTLEAISKNHNHNSLNKNDHSLARTKLPHHPNLNAGCSFSNEESYGDDDKVRKLYGDDDTEPKKPMADFAVRDLTRIQNLHKRATEKKNQNSISRQEKSYQPSAARPEDFTGNYSSQLVATLESGLSFGSGEYFMDVFIGTPPKHFSLIIDTGSDLNWIQCVPCYACFEQNGSYYDPKDSSSFNNITCHDSRCQFVSSPDPPKPCNAERENKTCPYFYWYGDSSNTTGDFAVETFTVNVTKPNGKSELKVVENVMFGCGHWNKGLFHGASGLLGLGRGPLSFASQIQSLYGHSFSYCFVNRNSNSSISSKLIFGENKELLNNPNLNFTSFVGGKEKSVDTFYYVEIKSIMVGGEVLKIPEETWNLSEDGFGGTIIDSGTTLTYFAEPAYEIIKEAFIKKIKGYSIVERFEPLKLCYNVSGIEEMELPEFGILFSDGAVWDFPVENYFIQIESDDVVCLAILGNPNSALSIIGNYQQQNFHILYDIKNSRLGYVTMKCDEV